MALTTAPAPPQDDQLGRLIRAHGRRLIAEVNTWPIPLLSLGPCDSASIGGAHDSRGSTIAAQR